MKKETREQMDVFRRHINGGKEPLAEALEVVERTQKAAQKEESAETKKYILMNKGIEIAEFHVNKWGEVEIQQILVALPRWLNDLESFILNRRAPNIEKT